ncbi:hypothetical protein CPT_Muenster_078 [Klebsiella phage Muenster]|nr:hypothetical protein CPT_Muenster_078 [Klebsiella phage Muenster]
MKTLTIPQWSNLYDYYHEKYKTNCKSSKDVIRCIEVTLIASLGTDKQTYCVEQYIAMLIDYTKELQHEYKFI